MAVLSPPHVWVERDLRPRFPALADQAIEAWEILLRATADGHLADSGWSRLALFCRNRSSRLRDWAVAVVADLADRLPAAQTLLEDLIQTGCKAQAVSVLAALHDTGSSLLRERCFRLGLGHRCGPVRALAADKILRWQLRSLLPALAQAVDAEPVAECRTEMAQSLVLLRDGLLIESGTAGDVHITVAVGRVTVAERFPESEVKERGVPALLAALRSSAERLLRFLH